LVSACFNLRILFVVANLGLLIVVADLGLQKYSKASFATTIFIYFEIQQHGCCISKGIIIGSRRLYPAYFTHHEKGTATDRFFCRFISIYF